MASELAGRERFDGVNFRETVVFDEKTFYTATSFRGTTFERNASFVDARFTHDVSFDGAVFKRDAWFGHTTFEGAASFDGAKFRGTAGFDGASFEKDASFNHAVFKRDLIMGRINVDGAALMCAVHICGDSGFEEATFRGRAELRDARFDRSVVFDRCRFLGPADFGGAQFGGTVRFCEVAFEQDAAFRRATFAGPAELGPLHADDLDFERAHFEQPVHVRIGCPHASFRAAVFREGVDLRARWTRLDLQKCDFCARPSLIAALEPEDDEVRFVTRKPLHDGARQRSDDHADADARPRVALLQQAKVDGLTLSGVDVRECRFVGAHGLERMRLERSEFSRTPPGWQRRRRDRGRIRWTKRQTLADEHHWRTSACGAEGWASADGAPVPEPEQIAAAYRALRMGREENKDAPGAADFYYGEMEMRREHGRRDLASVSLHPHGGGEQALLWLYWLISGYALRPARVLAALAVVIVLFAVLFSYVGFKEPAFLPSPVEVSGSGSVIYEEGDTARTELEDAVEALTFAAGTATAILNAPERALEPEGSVMRVFLRILGPILFGLALLGIRGRVKR